MSRRRFLITTGAASAAVALTVQPRQLYAGDGIDVGGSGNQPDEETATEYAIWIHSEPVQKTVTHTTSLIANPQNPFGTAHSITMVANGDGPTKDVPGSAPYRAVVAFHGFTRLDIGASLVANGITSQMPDNHPNLSNLNSFHESRLYLKKANGTKSLYQLQTKVLDASGDTVSLEDAITGDLFATAGGGAAPMPLTVEYQASLGTVECGTNVSGYRISQNVVTTATGQNTQTAGSISNSVGQTGSIGLNLSKKATTGIGFDFNYEETSSNANSQIHTFTDQNNAANSVTLVPVTAALEGAFTWDIVVGSRPWKRTKATSKKPAGTWVPAWDTPSQTQGWSIPPQKAAP